MSKTTLNLCILLLVASLVLSQYTFNDLMHRLQYGDNYSGGWEVG